ncbi:hypothetical protein AX14_007676 [Amanita brunnescens Koide BX004]|nr:hypothetical protein AX14_007676 [Amanita brunnescens Koide BX004]
MRDKHAHTLPASVAYRQLITGLQRHHVNNTREEWQSSSAGCKKKLSPRSRPSIQSRNLSTKTHGSAIASTSIALFPPQQ